MRKWSTTRLKLHQTRDEEMDQMTESELTDHKQVEMSQRASRLLIWHEFYLEGRKDSAIKIWTLA
jgi:hypothetical protein